VTLRPDDVERLLDEGALAGCTEALFCLGDRPEAAFPSYRQELASLGYGSTVEYLVRAGEMALERGLLPHTNAGLLTSTEMGELKHVNASLGLMLECVSPRLCLPGQAHHRCPDKNPVARLAMLAGAGAQRIPFTTGILVGIGETRRERIESLLAIRSVHEEHRHIQEVIVQPFKPHSRSAMPAAPEPSTTEVVLTVALARIILPPDITVQVPPNLDSRQVPPGLPPADGLDDLRRYLAAGINDLGGISHVTPDYINLDCPWPPVDSLRATCREAGFVLEPRLAVHKRFLDREGFVAPKVRRAIASIASAQRAASPELT